MSHRKKFYACLGSIPDNDLFADKPDIQEAITKIDESLATSSMGAYIIATGRK